MDLLVPQLEIQLVELSLHLKISVLMLVRLLAEPYFLEQELHVITYLTQIILLGFYHQR